MSSSASLSRGCTDGMGNVYYRQIAGGIRIHSVARNCSLSACEQMTLGVGSLLSCSLHDNMFLIPAARGEPPGDNDGFMLEQT